MNIGSCPRCGSNNLKTRPNPKNSAHTDVYCGDCGRWIKFANKDDLRLLSSCTESAEAEPSSSPTIESLGYTNITESIKNFAESYAAQVAQAYLHTTTSHILLISKTGSVVKYAGTYEYTLDKGIPLTREEVLACAELVK